MEFRIGIRETFLTASVGSATTRDYFQSTTNLLTWSFCKNRHRIR